MRRFDPARFVEACISSSADGDPLSAVREVVLRAVSDPVALESAFPEPLADDDDDGVLFRSADLLIAHVSFPPRFSTGIHEHKVPAVIGVWAGHENNHLFARSDRGLRSLGVQRVAVSEVLTMSADAIHDVHSPELSHSSALHVYLGDITAIERSRWDDTASDPVPFDLKSLNEDGWKRPWRPD